MSTPIIVEHKFGSFGPFIKYGVGYGSIAAMILSYSINKSILWMFVDSWFSWIYVVFFALFRS